MERFVARQPIFDRTRSVYGYELLFRSGFENFFSGDAEDASRSVIGDSLTTFGLDTLIGDRKAFFNCTRKVLVEQLYESLPRERAVVELLETVTPDDQVVAACVALKQAGYLLALDDFVYAPEFERLLDLADIVKVDILATPPEKRRAYAKRFLPRGKSLLAEKVETHEHFEEAAGLGYELFQGYFFCRPQIMSRRRLPASKLNCLRLLQEVQKRDVDFDRVETIIKQDVSLSLRLLRYLNSAAFGWRDKVSSIKQALIVLGEAPLRQWTGLVVMTALGDDKPAELVSTCLARARFCELLAPIAGLGNRELDLFFLGLLSALDALVDRPLDEVLADLAVSDEIRAALDGADTPFGTVYALVLAFERGEWDAAQRAAAALHVAESRLPDLYHTAVSWAQAVTTPTPEAEAV